MKGTVTLENGQVIEIEINEKQLAQMQTKKKTGYERVNAGEKYYYVFGVDNKLNCVTEKYINIDHITYVIGNYYSDKTIAENNTRADTLLRQLRRFAVENRKEKLNWKDMDKNRYKITYDHDREKLGVDQNEFIQNFGAIYFDTKGTAQEALEKFKDELIWYFTEYKDSL